MPSPGTRWDGWRGVCLVAVTYVYFLIFAQFAFLQRLADLGIADNHLKLALAAMAGGGILFSLLAAGLLAGRSPRLSLQAALAICASAALLSLLRLNLAGSVAVSLSIGCGLGLLTVTLVSSLDAWIGSSDLLLKVGLGTGIGYFLCNVPLLFTASPGKQAIASAGLCLLGVFAASRPAASSPAPAIAFKTPNFSVVLLSFTALVWLDSAVFFIIQSNPALKAGTWQGTLHLWTNGTLHLAAALASAWLLARKGLSFVFGLAFLSLTIACLLLLDPAHVAVASFFYPIGVSLYSVALVAYPALLLTDASLSKRARRAGILYAVAGWCASAMGIGMAQNLGRVPIWFVGLACALILGPQLPGFVSRHRREASAVGAVALVSLCTALVLRAGKSAESAVTPIQRGRQVYIAEGCIHCHSQYVRPNTPDVLTWGPTETLAELRAQHPPLIGNRRQGPDLSQVGVRRSPLWLEAHFDDPRALSPASFMPSYGYLFRQPDHRGDDLVAYLSSLHSAGTEQHLAQERSWHPVLLGDERASPSEGAGLFLAECATCHNPQGATRRTWHAAFKRLPPDLVTGPWLDVQSIDTSDRLAQIIKFGVPGTDMPGHEYLSDRQVASLALWVGAGRQRNAISNASHAAIEQVKDPSHLSAH